MVAVSLPATAIYLSVPLSGETARSEIASMAPPEPVGVLRVLKPEPPLVLAYTTEVALAITTISELSGAMATNLKMVARADGRVTSLQVSPPLVDLKSLSAPLISATT